MTTDHVRQRRPLGWLCLLLLSGIMNVSVTQGAEANDIRAGVAKEPFTLPSGIPLAGYSKRKGQPSQGVHDPVAVRALVIEDGQTMAALVSCDLLIVDDHLFDAVHQQLIARGFPTHMVLVLAATHTHSGPGAYGTRFFEKISMGHFNAQVFDRLVHTIVQTVVQARTQTVPVQISYGTVQTHGLVQNRVDPRGLVEDELIVSAWYPLSSTSPLAVIVDFSAHPTALGSWNRLLSADYPGVVVEEIEHELPGVVCLFFAGSVGDQAPMKAGIGYERATWIGQTLAQDALAVLRDAHPESPQPFRARQDRVALPPAKIRLGSHVSLPRWMGRRLVDDEATLSLVRLGPQVFFGVPCDLEADLGRALKTAAQAHALHPLVINFASDYIGYCVSEARYQAKEYESFMAFNGPQAGALLTQHLIEMMQATTADKP